MRSSKPCHRGLIVPDETSTRKCMAARTLMAITGEEAGNAESATGRIGGASVSTDIVSTAGVSPTEPTEGGGVVSMDTRTPRIVRRAEEGDARGKAVQVIAASDGAELPL